MISPDARLSRWTSGFGPATREKSRSVPAVAEIGTSLSAAPRALLDQRRVHAPIFAAGEITAGAVDRIDDPDPIFAETRLVIGAFFRQPAISPRGGSQAAP